MSQEAVQLKEDPGVRLAYAQSAADPPTHSRLRLWSTPIMMPRPMRSSGKTGVSSPPSGQTYMMRISAWVMPCGV